MSDWLTQKIKSFRDYGIRFHAGDNIARNITKEELEMMRVDLAEAFQTVLKTMLIDVETDPNSKGTARRLADMYIDELFAGRYQLPPEATAFPNERPKYNGMLVVRAEIKSLCSHHHQPVNGVCYIGVIPGEKVIGLSKYSRIAQWCARRGTLQEELCNNISFEIMKATETENVGVYIAATHGCCENRGIMAKSSLTQTTVLHGNFHEADVKNEFFQQIELQTRHANSQM